MCRQAQSSPRESLASPLHPAGPPAQDGGTALCPASLGALWGKRENWWGQGRVQAAWPVPAGWVRGSPGRWAVPWDEGDPPLHLVILLFVASGFHQFVYSYNCSSFHQTCSVPGASVSLCVTSTARCMASAGLKAALNVREVTLS